jgi:hypothetical protein
VFFELKEHVGLSNWDAADAGCLIEPVQLAQERFQARDIKFSVIQLFFNDSEAAI